MLGINSNINSLIAQQNLTGSGSALSQAITRLSSGKRINSAADDAAGLAISNIMQTQINGLNQGVSNSNDGVSMVQTASSGLSSLTNSLQRIRQLAVQASNGSMTNSDRAALQQEVSQQVSEINRIASQTTYNGMNILNGSLGSVSFQVGANVGQSINLNLTQNVSAETLGGGFASSGSVLGSVSGLSLNSSGTAVTSGATITSVNIVADGKGGFTFTDQNGVGISSTASGNLFTVTANANPNLPSTIEAKVGSALDPSSAISTINTNNGSGGTTIIAAGTTLGTIQNISIDSTGKQVPAGTANAITSVTVKADGQGNMLFYDQNGTALTAPGAGGSPLTNYMSYTAATGYTAGPPATITASAKLVVGGTDFTNTAVDSVNTVNTPEQVSNIDISTAAGASAGILSIDSALNTVNNLQATLGAAQNRFSAISTTQQAQATDLSTAQSQIQDANFAQETANLSKAQVLQQAGISVLAQANSQPQQILKLLQ
ncbi:flagellin [Paraburkholderia sp. A1RI-2L]|uniref:flagellin N-terminal helical domain-containing protein n=1 Tax=Paraburkholderia sp. A1RI-2L TaxID=3028367 RepID=UPI003B81AB6E